MDRTPLTAEDEIVAWLLDGDVSIQYQVRRDLLGSDEPELRQRIAGEGWGARFLSQQKEGGHWGDGYYRLKWISTHYTVLDLKNLGIDPDQPAIRETLAKVLNEHKGSDGGINPAVTIPESDICLNGMFLNFASYFKMPGAQLESIVDFILAQQMPDGGFNCNFNRQGAVHSSLHSTLSLLEGFLEYRRNGYLYRLAELDEIAVNAREFILQHRLYKSDKTGEIINKRFLMLTYPSRWFYDILRALDYFQSAGIPYDPRMGDALDVLRKKRRNDGTWPVQAPHSGKVHFQMEETGKPSRWNTLRAMRVMKAYGDP